MDNYLLLKSLHLLGVVIFLGNIIVTAFWKVLANRTRNPDIVAYAQRLVTVTDFVFTIVGVALIVVTGHLMATKLGSVDSASWIWWGWVLFVACGVIWITVLLPVQIWQARLAKHFVRDGVIPARYWTLSTVWTVFGLIATLLPLSNIYFMVFKPA